MNADMKIDEYFQCFLLIFFSVCFTEMTIDEKKVLLFSVYAQLFVHSFTEKHRQPLTYLCCVSLLVYYF
jgi:hypothetical protein